MVTLACSNGSQNLALSWGKYLQKGIERLQVPLAFVQIIHSFHCAFTTVTGP